MVRRGVGMSFLLFVVPALCVAQDVEESGTAFDGSFENGPESPRGWHSREDAECQWLVDDAHSGWKAVRAVSAKPRSVWVTDNFAIDAVNSHIIDGWLRAASGEAWLEVHCLSADGRVLNRLKSPRVKTTNQWTYIPVEVPQIQNHRATDSYTAQIAFWVKGDAALDDVTVRPLQTNCIINGSFEMGVDSKGRFPYWNEEKDRAFMKGKCDGRYEFDTTTPGEGTGSLQLTAVGDWFAFTSIYYPVWEWTDKVILQCMVSADADTRLALVWVDSGQNVIRVDFGGREKAAPEWRRVTAGPFKPPKGAHGVRPVLVVLNGARETENEAAARFDAVTLRATDRPFAQVTVNQVGYDRGGPKRAFALTNFFPNRPESATFDILENRGRSLHKGNLVCKGRMTGEKEADWGWYFWEADFSHLVEEGEYELRARIGKAKAASPTFRIGRNLLFLETANANVDFFFVQRCGFEVPGWHAACHLDCAKLPDGTHRDLNGGWHSAGDYNKLNWEYGDGGVFYALINAYESAPKRFETFNRDNAGLCDILDEAWWGAKFLTKVQVPETGGIINHIEQGPDRKTWMRWCPPEETTDNTVGTDDDPIVNEGPGNSPLAIGAWARLSRLLDERRVANNYLDNAWRLWKHATADGSGAPSPLLLTSSVDLYRVTKEERVLEYARRSVEGLLATGESGGQLNNGYGDSGDIPAAALAHFALRLPDDPLCARIKQRLKEHTPGFLAEADNALGLMMQKPGKEGYFFDPSSALGCNYQICCRAWSALMVYRVTGDKRLLTYATDQLDFLLGRNPYGLCMMEGEGSVNLPRYHHRYITIPGHERGAVPGAIPNGFVRDLAGNDRPGVDLSTGGRLYPSYRTNEPWLVHNVFYTLAVTALYEAI